MAPVSIIKGDDYEYKWGYINKAGKTVIPFDFSYAGSFSDNVAVVVKGDLSLPDFKNGKAEITDTNDNSYCINKQGKKVTC